MFVDMTLSEQLQEEHSTNSNTCMCHYIPKNITICYNVFGSTRGLVPIRVQQAQTIWILSCGFDDLTSLALAI
eukprot:5050279-Amphidinium_carterae.1